MLDFPDIGLDFLNNLSVLPNFKDLLHCAVKDCNQIFIPSDISSPILKANKNCIASESNIRQQPNYYYYFWARAWTTEVISTPQPIIIIQWGIYQEPN